VIDIGFTIGIIERMSKAVTIHDIAREAGVSPSTVSRVLNGTVPVAEDKRAAVLAVIERHKYRPNVVARGLARGTTGAIGVLTQAISSQFYGEILYGIEQGLRGSAYHAVFASANWQRDEELAALDLLVERRVDAMLVLGGLVPDEQLRRVAEEIPLIVVGRSVEGLEAHCLRVDDELGAYTATRYLIDLGHRRIVHITGALFHQDARDRQAGYCRALEEAGLPADPQLIVEGDYTEHSGLLASQALLSRGTLFSAIFTANDQMAYGVRLGLFRRGLRVPEDISLVGFDDLLGSRYSIPPLTTIRQPTTDLGREAAQAALRLLEGQPPAIPTPAVELVIRESAAQLR
jgi:LacI family transcriptional regulator